jgi:hypothetical protein
MKSGWPAATARQIGLTGEIDFTTSRVGMTLHVPCKPGNHVADVTVSPGMNPIGIAKEMLRKGWTVGRKLACPEHSRKEKIRPAPAPKPAMPVHTIPTTQPAKREISPMNATVTPITKPEPTDAAKKAHRLAMMMLEEAYDEARKCYKPGWSDTKIASESGASEKHVADTRATYFGPTGEPVELTALRAAIDEAERVMLTRLQICDEALADERKTNAAAVAQLRSRLTAICQKNGWPIAA